jgi:energy-coupling factor transporter ATP-binding protein EcfA2/energy-coupling factor transporter transmembrane protein EcfT
VLPGLDLDIPSGQRVLLAGPSGAGKSTLLRAIAGVLLTADVGRLTGEVLVDGAPAGSHAGQAGLLLQDPADAMVAAKVGRDVAFGPENVAMDRPAIWDRVAKSLAAVAFPYDETHPTGQLSGGEGQRLALAGAVALRPGLMLLDEPTAMLDEPSADEVRRAVLDAVTARGSTLVVVEHRLEPWLGLVDRIVVLSKTGAVVADGPPAEVLRRQAESLAAQGVWLPGLPPPEPLLIDAELAGPWRGRHPEGQVLLAADALAVPGRLAPVTTELAAGRVTAVRGRSGAGKSTLLAALAGLLAAGSGRVVAERALSGGLGPDPAAWPSAELTGRIGWVAQHPEQGFVARSVRDELLAGLPPDAEARADGLLRALGLSHLSGVDPYRLSGGEQRRLALAAALTQGPQLLLFDEPTLGQDRLTWAAVCGALMAARAGGASIVVATHDTLLVDRLADATLDLSGAAGPGPGAGPDRSWPPARRCGPLSVMVVSLLALVSSVFIRTWQVGVVTLAAVLLLAPLAVGSPREAARRALPGVLAALSIGWSSWLLGGRDVLTGVAAGLRILVLVLPGSLLTAYLDASRLGDDLGQRLRLPARPVVAAVAALQRLEDLGTIWAQARWARRVRGLAADRSPLARAREIPALTFVLLVQTIRRAGRMAVAMDARGFAGARVRTWAEPSRWGRPDTVLVLVGLAVAAIPIASHVG